MAEGGAVSISAGSAAGLNLQLDELGCWVMHQRLHLSDLHWIFSRPSVCIASSFLEESPSRCCVALRLFAQLGFEIRVRKQSKKKKGQDLYEPRHSFTVSVPLLDFEAIINRLNVFLLFVYTIYCTNTHMDFWTHTVVALTTGHTQHAACCLTLVEWLTVRSTPLTTGVVDVPVH